MEVELELEVELESAINLTHLDKLVKIIIILIIQEIIIITDLLKLHQILIKINKVHLELLISNSKVVKIKKKTKMIIHKIILIGI